MRFAPRLIVVQPTSYCNINCSYCYLTQRNLRQAMSDQVLDAIGRKILAILAPEVETTFVWHGGEPTSLPIRWYENAYRILQPSAPPNMTYAMQTNGVSVDDAWVAFARATGTSLNLSIDGPQHFHDARRLTRSGKGTWAYALDALRRLKASGFEPNVITVLSPEALDHPDAFFEFYRDNGIYFVNFNIDEQEGLNPKSSFDGHSRSYDAMVDFLKHLVRRAFRERYPLHIREIERIARWRATGQPAENEQVTPWGTIVVGWDGSISTFSPEAMEEDGEAFRLGNILTDELDGITNSVRLSNLQLKIAHGVDLCQTECPSFGACGGGSPVNKLSETGRLDSSETQFCRLTIKAAHQAFNDLTSPQFHPPPPKQQENVACLLPTV